MLNRWFTGLLGVGACVLMAGCGARPADTDSAASGAAEAVHDHAGEHDHAAAGPHGGHLIVLGEEEYHAEVAHDEATHTVTVYLLDAAAEQAVTSEQSEIVLDIFKAGDFVEYTLKAADGEGVFASPDEELAEVLLHAEEVKGRLHATIEGKEYVGIIEHVTHGHDGHDAGTVDDGHDHAEEGATADEDGHDHGEEGAAHDHAH